MFSLSSRANLNSTTCTELYIQKRHASTPKPHVLTQKCSTKKRHTSQMQNTSTQNRLCNSALLKGTTLYSKAAHLNSKSDAFLLKSNAFQLKSGTPLLNKCASNRQRCSSLLKSKTPYGYIYSQ